MLFAPGNNARILAKVFDVGSDAVALDLEDAVPTTHKAEAREMVAEAIDRRQGSTTPRIVVRVNGPSSGLTVQDLETAIRPGVWGIQFTKIESAEYLTRYAGAIDALEREQGLPVGGVRVICSVDSAHLAMQLPSLLRATPRMYCVIAGGVDFANDLGVSMSETMAESLWVRSYAVLASREAGVHPPLHPPSLDWQDLDALRELLSTGRQLGFQGGVAIHPRQVEVMNDVFSPTEEEASWAKDVMDEFRRAEGAGIAALEVRGALVDYALVERARQILEHAGISAEGRQNGGQ